MDCPSCGSAVWTFASGGKPPKGVVVESGHVCICSGEKCKVVVVNGAPGSLYSASGQRQVIRSDGTPPVGSPPQIGGWKRWVA